MKFGILFCQFNADPSIPPGEYELPHKNIDTRCGFRAFGGGYPRKGQKQILKRTSLVPIIREVEKLSGRIIIQTEII